jgi:hypothetical protein
VFCVGVGGGGGWGVGGVGVRQCCRATRTACSAQPTAGACAHTRTPTHTHTHKHSEHRRDPGVVRITVLATCSARHGDWRAAADAVRRALREAACPVAGAERAAGVASQGGAALAQRAAHGAGAARQVAVHAGRHRGRQPVAHRALALLADAEGARRGRDVGRRGGWRKGEVAKGAQAALAGLAPARSQSRTHTHTRARMRMVECKAGTALQTCAVSTQPQAAVDAQDIGRQRQQLTGRAPPASAAAAGSARLSGTRPGLACIGTRA